VTIDIDTARHNSFVRRRESDKISQFTNLKTLVTLTTHPSFTGLGRKISQQQKTD